MSDKQKPKRSTIASGRRELKEIIETCDAISERRFNPFFLDIKFGVDTLRKHYSKWETFDDHCLDAHTLNRLSEVVRLQNTQLKFQSSALYSDPEFLSRKLEHMSEKRLSEVFLQSWHPLAELEQLTNETITDSLSYWNALLPIKERWLRKTQEESAKPHEADSNTLNNLGIASENFGEHLIELWNELRESFESTQKPVDYWLFIRKSSYQETVERAYHVSFLITYGYAKLQFEGDKLTLVPASEPAGKATSGVSFPIPITRD
ncbi:MAG TPA: hypothetical protein VEH56_03395 [Candidatus Saccharimonadales bacterium]|nr:hypothetical protein [Candidatus Saccharimonadales bacterium]